MYAWQDCPRGVCMCICVAGLPLPTWTAGYWGPDQICYYIFILITPPWTIPISKVYCVYNWLGMLSITCDCPDNWFRRLSIKWNCPDNWFRRLAINWNCPDNWFRRLSIRARPNGERQNLKTKPKTNEQTWGFLMKTRMDYKRRIRVTNKS